MHSAFRFGKRAWIRMIFRLRIRVANANMTCAPCALMLIRPRDASCVLRKLLFFAALLCSLSLAQSNSRVPPEVRYKSAYVNAGGRPAGFSSAMLWGIAIADSRVSGYEGATVEIARTQLICRVDGRDFVLNDDRGSVRGGLYRRYPWFGTDAHDPLPMDYSHDDEVLLRAGTRVDRAWHFWAASPRAEIPEGHLEGCTVKVRARISGAALLQVGFDYWRDRAVGFGNGGNNHEAGASDWYLSLPEWQEATFSDVRQ